MAYTKNTWVDQDVERPKTYEVTTNQDGSITLTDSFGLVTELGTPVNATNMNHIEQGVYDNDTHIGDLTLLETDVKTDLVSAINEAKNGGSSRNIGEIVTSTIPLTDAGLHLLDGSLLSYGSYSDFIDYIADLYDSGDYTDIFETEANWQTAVTTYGVCGKFVYDSVNNTVRLPKYSNKIYTKDINITAPVIGNDMTIGLTDGTLNAGLINGSGGALYGYTGDYGTAVGQTRTTGGLSGTKTIGLTTDGSKSGIIADLANLKSPLDGYYYIVIATSTKTQIVVDIDEIATDLNGKADVDLTNVSGTSGLRRLIKTGGTGNAWYKIYSEYNATNGNYIGLWVECGNTYYKGSTMASTNNTIAFPFVADSYEFTGTNYTFIPQVIHSTADLANYGCYEKYQSRTATSTVLRVLGAYFGYSYYACGYIQASS